MKISYLVIWQYGDNEQSRDNTPVDVKCFSINDYEILSAQKKYDKIVDQLKKDINELGSDNITIVGIFKL